MTATRTDTPSNPTRRRVIFAGLAGAIALGFARWLAPTSAPGAEGARALSADGADVMSALVPAFLDGALPAERGERDAAVRDTVDAIALAIAGLPPIARHELDALFSLLALAPVRIFVAGIDETWRRAGIRDADAFLERLRRSRWAQKRAAYDALHQLTFASWYANPRAWPAIGYPGPPDLS